MDDLAPPDSGPRGRSGHGIGWFRAYRVLSWVFTLVAVGSFALVCLDIVIGRPMAGDVFITTLNALAALVLWRRMLVKA